MLIMSVYIKMGGKKGFCLKYANLVCIKSCRIIPSPTQKPGKVVALCLYFAKALVCVGAVEAGSNIEECG